MNVIGALLGKLDGWKTIVAYILVQVPWFTDHPLVADAITKVLVNPKDTEAWITLILQLCLLAGVADILRKNITQGTARKGAST
jgi:hypothetical protein